MPSASSRRASSLRYQAPISFSLRRMRVGSTLRHSPAALRVMLASTQCVCRNGSRSRLVRCRNPATTMPSAFTLGRRRVAGSQPRVSSRSDSTQSSVARTASSCARITRRSPMTSASSDTDFGAEKVMSQPGRCARSPSRMRPSRMSVPGTKPASTVSNRFGRTCPRSPIAFAAVPCQKLACRCSGSFFA